MKISCYFGLFSPSFLTFPMVPGPNWALYLVVSLQFLASVQTETACMARSERNTRLLFFASRFPPSPGCRLVSFFLCFLFLFFYFFLFHLRKNYQMIHASCLMFLLISPDIIPVFYDAAGALAVKMYIIRRDRSNANLSCRTNSSSV